MPASLPSLDWQPFAAPANQVLRGVRVLTLALNLPGPAAVMRLAAMGAHCVKLDPPGGDPMRHYARGFHALLHRGVHCEVADLKTPAGQARLAALMAESDVLITSSRPSALARLGLDGGRLQGVAPHLTWVEIVGEHAPDDEVPGHDLTYLAEAGLVDGALPATLWADMAGSLLAVEAVLQAVIAQRSAVTGTTAPLGTASASAPEQSPALHLRVALADAVRYAALPRAAGLTQPGGLLGGAHPGYQTLRCADGWVTVAALEPHFLARWQTLAALTSSAPADQQIEQARAWCAVQTADTLNAQAHAADLPLVAWRDDPP